jgi:2',3'-cyclic-nucleotide 2'-phosphodiesterase (5'-nucleotidase family)
MKVKPLIRRFPFAVTVIRLLLWTLPLQAAEIHLIHYNDFHVNNAPRFIPEKGGAGYYRSGAAYLKSIVDSLRDIHHNSLLIHAGDDFQGSPICGFTAGASQIQVMNAMGVDIFTPGNHEFDYGDTNLIKQLEQGRFHVVNCNLADSSGNLHWPPYEIRELDGVKVGFLGVITGSLPQLTVAGNLKETRVLDPVSQVRKYLAELEQRTQLQVLISHCGVEMDSLLATEVPGIEIIIGGHSHTELPVGKKVGKTLIVQAGCCGNWVGDLKLDFDPRTGMLQSSDHLIPVDSRHTTPDPEMQKLVDSFQNQLPEELTEVIGTLTVPWVRTRGESNVADWTTDVVREYAGAEICFINVGSFRRDLPAGPITRLDIWEVNPFSNHFVVFDMEGLQIYRFLQMQANDPQEFFAVSGLRYKINRKLRTVSGVFVGDESLVMNRRYRVVTNSYAFSHLREFLGVDPETVNAQHLKDLDRDVIMAAVVRQKTITAKNEGRIIFE